MEKTVLGHEKQDFERPQPTAASLQQGRGAPQGTSSHNQVTSGVPSNLTPSVSGSAEPLTRRGRSLKSCYSQPQNSSLNVAP